MRAGESMAGGSVERGYTLDELWGVARRRARPALLVFAAAAVLGTAGVWSLPSEYRAEATIILEPYRPHAELVTSAVTPLLEDRLRVARQQLLAGPLLESVVKKLDLYPKAHKKLGLEGAVALLLAHLEVHPDGESAVIVAYRTSQKDQAAPVVAAIAAGFAEANTKLRTAQAERVTAILAEELGAVDRKLDVQEATVRTFKIAHDGELPEQVDGNLREAERATGLLDSAQGYLRDIERRRSALPQTERSPELDRLSGTEADLIRQLNHARALFSDTHPETMRLEREVAGIVELKRAAARLLDGVQRERSQLRQVMARARRDAAQLEAKIKGARERAGAAARWGAELAVLERDRDVLREKHRSLLSRRVESEVSLALERRSAPAATHVVSPPIVPANSSAPDRMRLFLAVLAIGLGLGIGAGVLLESRDVSMRSPAQARAELGVPLLAIVPSLPAHAPVRKIS